MDFEDLQSMTANVASQLRKRGVTTVSKLAMLNLDALKGIMRGVSEKKIREIQVEAWKATGGWFKPGTVLEEERKNQLVFSTGCRSLDELLGGGVRTGSITEFTGEYGTGKTECLLTTLVEALGRNRDVSAVFYDTEETFSIIRMKHIAETRGYGTEELLGRFTLLKVWHTDQFQVAVAEADPLINNRNVKLILVDSIIAPLRAEYIGREMLAERQQILNNILRELLNYAKLYNLAVVVTNQVSDKPEQVYTYDPVEQKPPTGGNIMAHNAETRVYLRKAGGGNRRIARLIDSSWLPPGERVFQITERGIEDVQDETVTSKPELEAEQTEREEEGGGVVSVVNA